MAWEVLAFLRNHENTSPTKKSELKKLESDLIKVNRFVPNNKEVLDIQQQTQRIINNQRSKISIINEQFKDYKSYDKFLATLTATNNSPSQSNKKEFTLTLLSWDRKLLSQYNQNTTQQYLWLQKLLLSNYRKGLEWVTASDEYTQAQDIIKEIDYLENEKKVMCDNVAKNKLSQAHEHFDNKINSLLNVVKAYKELSEINNEVQKSVKPKV